MPTLPICAAIIHLARKRGLLDRAGCARLGILLAEAAPASVDAARQVLFQKGFLAPAVGKALNGFLAKPGQLPLGTYTPLVHLADGGMGTVWLAGSEDGKLVVAKTLRGNHAGNQELIYRFERETRYMQEMRHPQVVACLDHGIASDGTAFMILEFEPSGDLRELVLAEGWLPEGLALAIIYQVAAALGAAHQRQLIHRDIKPANIFCSRDGQAKLADFGIARSTTEQRTMLTMAGSIVGSPAYMSPEQVIGAADLDIRSDIYALGAVLYFCLCGMEPYQGEFNRVMYAHRHDPVPDILAVRPEVGAATAAIITRCMAKKREDRFRDPDELAAALSAALTGLPQAGPAFPTIDHEAATISIDLSTQGPLSDSSAARRSAIGDLETIALTDPTPTTRPPQPEIATIIADLSGAGDAAATIAMSPSQWGGQADAVPMQPRIRPTRPEATPIIPASTPTPLPIAPVLVGELADAFASAWLTLAGADGSRFVLWGRTQVTMGKLCEPPVDLCLRKYPTSRFRDECLKISRSHLRLRYDHGLAQAIITDLGSGNGTQVDGTVLAANTTRALTPGQDHRVCLAGVLDLRLRAWLRTEEPLVPFAGTGTDPGSFEVGLTRDHRLDAVTITRPDNRPELAYAMVLRRISLGGGGQLSLSTTPGPRVELGFYCGRWLMLTPAGWGPLKPGSTVQISGITYTVEPGQYQVFQSE